MAPLKANIYIPDAFEREINARRSSDEASRSETISTMAMLYAEVVKRHRPDFSVDEWKLLMDSLKGILSEGAAVQVAGLAIGIGDSIHLSQLDKKWHVDGRTLLKKLQALTFGAKLSIWDEAWRFWSAVARGEDPVVPGEAEPNEPITTKPKKKA